MFILSSLPAREIELESLDNLANKSSFAHSRLDEYPGYERSNFSCVRQDVSARGGRTLGYEQSSFKRNARDTEMTTRVTKGTRRERVGPI